MTTLCGVLTPRVIDQELSHDVGGHTNEVRSALPVRHSLRDHPKVSFMNESGWLQGRSVALVAEISASLFSQFVTTKKSGMGIGLPISRTIVEAHGGQIGGENRREGGAIFRFTLPRGRARRVKQPL